MRSNICGTVIAGTVSSSGPLSSTRFAEVIESPCTTIANSPLTRHSQW